MARALSQPHRVGAILELAAEEALSALGAASVSVSRWEPGEGVLRTLINVGELGPEEERYPVDEVYRAEDYRQLSEVIRELRAWTAALDDPGSDPAEIELLRSLGKGSSLAAPLLVDGGAWGELYATRGVGARPFTEGHIAYTETLVAIMASAISHALREEALEQLAYTDPLTGLPNRRAFEEAADRVAARNTPAEGAAGTVSAILVDVNGLKVVNDGFGHEAGDAVLRAVAALLLRHFGGLHAIVARLGGDEFGIVAAGHQVDGVLAAARRACVDADRLPYGAGIACGIASTGDAALAELIRAADAAQYRAKRQGRSGVVLAGPDAGLPATR
jgi:diguanylate cyclase (GGDEF)-like protein